ncbi:MAG: imidazole glycerol phosphate synthase subunit HisH [Ruminococcaceae bacterium]|nr:imidazole glycerol phosphate synthase subunit HisH [Oscillospiraceae bacterium]
MIAILDYGVGNLFSLRSSFAAIGATAVVTADPAVIHAADKLILPGVGAFEDAARKLRDSGLDVVLKEEAAKGKPLMGICLGMQLLFEKSYEYGEHEGLGLLKGSILPFAEHIEKNYKIPHIGWNKLSLKKDIPLWKYVNEGDYVYFVHSFFAELSEEHTAASAEYGITFTAAVAKDNVYGCQFHPEKSGNVGLGILRGFCEAEGL